ncbi:hypothetical protein AK812_SmicGene39424 [Symbiodinium microadriaticum]|uniref:Uncharacterized protein n=1 Tax=Symbiodinium microadriaticum TaxID=2951 RepID=A0A1Q9CB94_SYMMI|nr:hypothetical protein AK812_SmicGene39424 [Symbiodinium microadriaticum]
MERFQVSWLSIAESDGTLSYTAPSGANGGVSVADDKFFGQDGAVCIVTAWQEHKKYDLEAVAVSLGEELHPLSPKPHKEQGLMKPWTFAMACDISGADASTKFSYDRLIAGHPILDISSDGAITVAPASTLSEVFDALSLMESQRKALTLSCRVFGIFPDPDLAPVEATLGIVVQDTVCWVPQHIKIHGRVPVFERLEVEEKLSPLNANKAKCRSQCRADETCANYQFDSQCVRYDVRSDGNPVTVVAKVTNCTNEGMKVTHSDWYLAGTYCPLGRDAVLGGIVYLREHVTPQAVDADSSITKCLRYLREGSAGGCGTGEWALLAPSSGDFIDKAMDKTVAETLHFLHEEDEEGQPSLVLDDPGTTQPADYWLHPCDCAPDAWGPELPVDPQMYEHLPAAWHGVSLGGGNGVHFQSEEEVLQPADCEARCREQLTCLFFWPPGLFTGCDNLVREFSLEGDLKAKCWATSLRRSFLSMAFNSDGGTSVEAAGSVGLNLHRVNTTHAGKNDVDDDGGDVDGDIDGGQEESSNSGGAVYNPQFYTPDRVLNTPRSENAGSVWRSSVGDFEGYCSKNTVFRRVAAGYGADRPVTFIQGYTWSGFTFGNVLPLTHSVCSITRYTGSSRGRVLQSSSSKNWLHGHWRNHVGVIHYNGWVTEHERNPNVLDWLVLCGTNGATRAFDGLSSDTPTNIATKEPKKFTGTIPLYVNHGREHEKSDFAVMEVITWDRVLSQEEMLATVDYLKWKLRAGAVLEASEHLATESQHNLDSWGVQDLDNMQSKTTEVTFANGYKADLAGWTHTRYYARGFITNSKDVATAVVKGLSPAAQYLYQIYMVHEMSNWQGEAQVSVNHGVQARVQQNGINEHAYGGQFATIVCSEGTLKSPIPILNERLQCVNGDWYNSMSGLFLLFSIVRTVAIVRIMGSCGCATGFSVGARGYVAYDERNEQELYFFNRMALSIYTELGMVKELDVHAKHKYCLQPSSDGNMTVRASSACPARLVAQVTGWAGPQARLFKLLPVAEVGHSMGHVGSYLYGLKRPTDMWDLHIEADERTQDLHKPFSSYCGTSGALSSLDFGQLFAGLDNFSHTVQVCKLRLIQHDDETDHFPFGEFVDTGIVRSKTTTNWRDWHHLLAENYVECVADISVPVQKMTDNPEKAQGASGEALTAFKLDAAKLPDLNVYGLGFGEEGAMLAFGFSGVEPGHIGTQDLRIDRTGGLGACFDYYSAQVEIPSASAKGGFSQSINHWHLVLKGLEINASRLKALLNSGLLGDSSSAEGEADPDDAGELWAECYQCCKAGGAPVSFDPRGQLPELVGRYDGIYCPSSRDAHSGRVKFESGSGLTLSFERKSGSLPSKGQWCLDSECSDVTDSASPLGIKGAAFEVVNVSDFDGEFLGQMPKEKNKEFKAQQPKYAAECLNYENLWKDVSETFKDQEDEEVQTTSKLEADPSTKEQELDSYHPCEVAKTAGGIFGQWGGGDIERDLASAQLDYHSALADFVMDLTEETLGAVCGAIPDAARRKVMVAPLGAGIALNPGDICDGISELVGAVKNFAGPVSGFHFARQGWSIEQEPCLQNPGAGIKKKKSYAACNPMQIGFARAFCDIHCVRDAVIRGDRSIIRNLEMATKKTNNNLKALVKWSVDASHTDIGWIGEKLDYMHIINTAYMQDMVTKQSQAAEGELLQSTERAASFDELSKITAKGALQDAWTSKISLEQANAITDLPWDLRSLRVFVSLYRIQIPGSMMMQRQRLEPRRTQQGYKSLNRLQLPEAQLDISKSYPLLSLELYLDVAEDEVKAFQGSLVELKNYMDCKKGFSDLAAGYAQSMSALGRSHRHLRSTWRQGLLEVVPGYGCFNLKAAFQGFVTEEGCKSELVKCALYKSGLSRRPTKVLRNFFRSHILGAAGTGGVAMTPRAREPFKEVEILPYD